MSVIVFYGPTGGKLKDNLGGGEAGNRRTIELLKRLGNTVYVVEKPILKSRKPWDVLWYLFSLWAFAIWTPFYALYLSRDTVIHISGFYFSMIYPEGTISVLAKLFGVKINYEIRAGGAIDAYKNGGKIYQWVFLIVLKISNSVLVQGREYADFFGVSQRSKFIYYPNFVMDSLLVPFENLSKPKAPMKLVYFGRFSRTKNLEAIVDAVSYIRGNGISLTCDFIGSGNSSYIREIQSKVSSTGLGDVVKILPPMSSIQLTKCLPQYHFFVFPTSEPREGHSNSLTEAMSFGIVPVATNQGFNATVIGNSGLVIDNIDAKEIGELICSLWSSSDWMRISHEMWLRVRMLFTEEKALATLASVYNR